VIAGKKMMPEYSAGWNLLWTVPLTALVLGVMILLTLCGIGFAVGRRTRPSGLEPAAASPTN
jgi:hypothetical protein